MKYIPSLIYQFLLSLLLVCFGYNAQGQAYVEHYIDSNCIAIISVIDSTSNNPISNIPPYSFSIANLNYSSNSVATAAFDLSNINNGTYVVNIIDGLQNTYTHTIIVSCGLNPNASFMADSTFANASTCNTCDGIAEISIQNPIAGGAYSFSIDGGADSISSTPEIIFTNLCVGVHNVIASDTLGNHYGGTITIGCNTGPGQNATCQQNLVLDLGNNKHARLTPNDLSQFFISHSNNHFLVDGNNKLQYTIDYGCADLGFHAVALVIFDSTSQVADSCMALIQIVDSSFACNGEKYSINDSINKASNCSSCDAQYNFLGVTNTLNALQAPTPYSFIWSDGDTTTNRMDLCPFNPYTFTVYDANGVAYTKDIFLACDSMTGGTCFDSTQLDNTVNCPPVYVPVCGCNNVTYNNACEAEFQHGIIDWNVGACQNGLNDLVLVAAVSNSSFGCDTTISSHNGSIFVTPSGGIQPYFISWPGSSALSGFNPTGLAPGAYTARVSDNFGAQTIQTFVVGIDGCVWPGDTDDNTVANNFDLLPIALTYGDVGLQRNNPSIAWQGLQSNNWFIPFPVQNLPNYKHIDCNGDGQIDSLDVAAINLNYGQSYHRNSSSSLLGPTPFYVQSSNALAGDTVILDMNLGDANNMATDVYGVAFTLNYDSSLVKQGFTSVDFNGSWLGADLLSVQKEFHDQGRLEIAVTRKDHSPITGLGSIGTVSFTIRDDLIMGRINNTDTTLSLTIGISDIRVIDHKNLESGTNPQSGVVLLTPINSTKNIPAIENGIYIFPNPTKDLLNISSETNLIELVSIYNATGQCLQQLTPDAMNQVLDTQDLAQGIYIIAVQTQKGVYTQKVKVIK